MGAAAALNEVTVDTIKNYFAKCGITEKIVEDNNQELDEKFANLVKELTSQIYSDFTAEEYIDFNAEMCTAEPAIDSDQVDQIEASRNVCIEENLHGPMKVVEEDSDDGDEDEFMVEEVLDFRISPREALVLLLK